MTAALRTYGVLISVALANMLQYRVMMLLWAIWGIVAPLVSLSVWIAAARGRDLAGFDRSGLAGYFLATMIVGHLTMSWDMEVFGWLVRNGQLSARLLRPVHPVLQSVADNVAYKLMTSAILLPIWLLLGVALRPTLHLTVERALWLVPVILLAAALQFTWGYCVAMAAFWTTKNRAGNELYWTLSLYLAGRLAPLALLPPVLQAVAACLPFRWMLSFPVELTLGRVPDAQIPLGLAWQIAWLAAAVLVFQLIWARGIRQFSAVGA
jgi:ABC-2 type transport system permease protein